MRLILIERSKMLVISEVGEYKAYQRKGRLGV